MTYQIRITIDVVNEDGDVMNTRGQPSYLNRDGRLEATRRLTKQFDNVSDAHNALNLTWGFVGPIDTMLSRNK